MSLAPVFALMLVCFRCTALVASAPILGVRFIPSRIKLALGLVVGGVAWSAAGMPQVAVPDDVFRLTAMALSEVMVGLTAGLCSRMLFEAASTGGQIAGNSMGFGFGALLDPSSGAQSSAMGELYTALAFGAGLAMGLHREAITWLVRSVQQVPPGGVVDLASLCHALVTQSAISLALVTRVAWPIMAVTLITYGVLGLIGRTAPQLQLGNMGFAAAILSGGTAFYLTAPAAAQLCANAATQLFGGA